MTQAEAARQLGVTQQTYANYELGSSPRPSAPNFKETIRSIRDFLEIEDVRDALALAMGYPEAIDSADPENRVALLERQVDLLQSKLDELLSGNSEP